jgi:hypothetical protein
MGAARGRREERMQFRRMDEGTDADCALLAKVHETAA